MVDEADGVLNLAAVVVFFFQAEDGIRDLTVTGVQTCALPISFAPSRSQAGQTFTVNFTATDNNDPSWTSTQTVPIHVENVGDTPGSTPGSPPSTQPSPGVSGNECLTCNLEKGILAVAWFVSIGVIIGVVSSVTLLAIKRRARYPGRLTRLRFRMPMKTRRRANDPTQRLIKAKKQATQRSKRNNEQD